MALGNLVPGNFFRTQFVNQVAIFEFINRKVRTGAIARFIGLHIHNSMRCNSAVKIETQTFRRLAYVFIFKFNALAVGKRHKIIVAIIKYQLPEW